MRHAGQHVGTLADLENDSFSIVQGSIELKMDKSTVMSHSRWTNLRDTHVADTFANSQILFRKMKEQSEENGIKLLVLIIPTEERVTVKWAKENDVSVPALLDEAVENENIISELYLEFFETLSIPASDAARRMVDLMTSDLSDGIQTYVPGDEHPLEPGYSEYAKAASELFIGLHVRQ